MLVNYRLGILHPPRMPVAYEGLYIGISFPVNPIIQTVRDTWPLNSSARSWGSRVDRPGSRVDRFHGVFVGQKLIRWSHGYPTDIHFPTNLCIYKIY